jgi:hypothetical protein
MRNLSVFIHSFDFVHAQPLDGWIESLPDHLVAGVLAKPPQEYVVYLADAREATDETAGQTISGQVSFSLEAGVYRARLYSPMKGEYASSIQLRGGGRVKVDLKPFRHDIVLRVSRISGA